MPARVIPISHARRPKAPRVQAKGTEPAPLVRASATAYSNPQAGIAMQADLTAGIVHVIVGASVSDSIELQFTAVEARRIARQLLRLADAAEGTG